MLIQEIKKNCSFLVLTVLVDFRICSFSAAFTGINLFLRFLYEFSKVSSSLRKISACVGYSSECVHEMHSKTAHLRISRKPGVSFLRELDTFKSMV